MKPIKNWETIRLVLLTIYYFAIIATLLWMQFTGSFETPKYIYQGF